MENKLISFRKEKILSQVEVARLLNKDVSFIRDLESRKNKDIKLTLAYRLASIYAVDLNDIYSAIVI